MLRKPIATVVTYYRQEEGGAKDDNVTIYLHDTSVEGYGDFFLRFKRDRFNYDNFTYYVDMMKRISKTYIIKYEDIEID